MTRAPAVEVQNYAQRPSPAKCPEHEEAAQRAELLGQHRAARWIRHCTPIDSEAPLWRRWECRQRALCPSCAERYARRMAARLFGRVQGMRAVAAVFTAPSGTLWGLRESIDTLSNGLRVLRRRRFFARVVRGGAGAVHPKLDRGGRRWSTHAHLVLDLVPGSELDLERTRSVWASLTGGEVRLQPLRDAWGLCSYAAKAGRSKDFAPEPGEMDPGRHRLLLDGIRRRRLWVAWGTARRRKGTS